VGRLLIPYVGEEKKNVMRTMSGMLFTPFLIINYFEYFKVVEED
jgi:hypothetical protein